MMTKNEVIRMSRQIIAGAIEVHRTLGPGLLESVYELCLEQELISRGFEIKRQCKVPVSYKGISLDADLRFDMLVNDTIVVELKAVQEVHPIEYSKLMTYMNLLQKPKGLLVNFFTPKLVSDIKSFVNEHFATLPDGDD